MQNKLLFLLLLFFSLFLSGCSFDESFENNQQHDGDDMDVIQNIGPQALDQMLRGLSVPVVVQESPGNVVPSYAPNVVLQQSSKPIVSSEIMEPIVESSPTLIVPEYDRESENTREGNDD